METYQESSLCNAVRAAATKGMRVRLSGVNREKVHTHHSFTSYARAVLLRASAVVWSVNGVERGAGKESSQGCHVGERSRKDSSGRGLRGRNRKEKRPSRGGGEGEKVIEIGDGILHGGSGEATSLSVQERSSLREIGGGQVAKEAGGVILQNEGIEERMCENAACSGIIESLPHGLIEIGKKNEEILDDKETGYGKSGGLQAWIEGQVQEICTGEIEAEFQVPALYFL